MPLQIFLTKIDSSETQYFITLWNRIANNFGQQCAQNFCDFILNDQSTYYEYLFMPESELLKNINALIPQSSSITYESMKKEQNSLQYAREQRNKPSYMKEDLNNFDTRQFDKMQIQNDMKEVNHFYQSQFDRMQIQNDQNQEQKWNLQKKFQDQNNPQHLNKQQKFDQQTPDVYHYYEKTIQNLKRDKQFNNKITEENLQSFFQFCIQYNQLQLIDKHDIKNQAKNYFLQTDDNSFLHQMMLVDSALYYSSPNHRLRITQLLAIYCFICNPKANKVLLQILTGQGKSTTIACLAAIMTMRGKTVDIITTNNILAKRDAQEKKIFFDLLNIKVSHNISDQKDRKNQEHLNPKKCYSRGTVVYGTPFTYQVDLLYDQYKRKGTRNGRPYDIAIIDQVDSMFIDEKANQTLLSSTYGGFSELVLPMRILWQTVVMHNIVKKDDKLILFAHGKQNGQIIKGEMNEVMNVIINDIRKEFENEIIPLWRLEFIQFSLKDWIWSAIQAAHVYKQDHHYVIENGKIIPVDFRNTGCLQKNVQWEHGLHQFLQMKHDLQVSTQSMTSNFMSNIGHFSRYKYIYGLTGTLGSNQSKKFLQKTYQADMLQIPPFRDRKLQIIPGFFMYSQKQWLQKILKNIDFMMKQKRSVLVISQTIQHVKVISQALKYKNIFCKSMRLHMTGEQKHSDNVSIQQIIIATNVAGRGTDLKASEELIKNGGLHVIITFMPQNLRVQMQARGRAGRNGASGSSELIVNHYEYFNECMMPLLTESQFYSQRMQQNISLICQKVRDSQQASAMNSDLQKVKQLRAKDKLFQYFCSMVGKIPDYQQNKAKRDALQQTWAMFLKKADYLKLSNQQRYMQGKQLIDQFGKNSQNYYHASHSVWRGVNQIRQNNFQKAKGFFQQLQLPNTTNTNKIAGKIMQSSIDIKTDDKKEKKNYPKALQLMASALPLIQKRKDLIKANHTLTISSNNQKVVNLMDGQNLREVERLRNTIVIEPNQMNSLQFDRSADLRLNGDIQALEKKNIQQLMNIPQINVLNAVSDHIKKQIDKISKIGPKQYADIQFQALTKIIDTTENKQQQTQEAVDKLMTDLPYLPVVEIKKIKVPWWKRALVFAVGVLQICVGALIVSASGGAAASFGSFMIHSGIKDCMAAIFTPQVCGNLGKFYTQKSLEYTMALATIGVQGMSQLARISKNGFQTIKNSTMSQVLQKATQGIRQGLVKGGFDLTGLVQKQVFQSISSRLMGNQNGTIKSDPMESFKAIQKPEFKEFIKQGAKQERKLQFKGQQIKQRFQKQAESCIKAVVNQIYPHFLQTISNLQIQARYIKILIENAFEKSKQTYFGTADRNQIYKRMLYFIAQSLEDNRLAEKVIQEFRIDTMIKETIQQISYTEDYNKVIESSENDMRNKIIEELNKVSQYYSDKCQAEQISLQNELDRINNTAFTVSQRNRQIDEYNNKLNTYKTVSKKFNDFIAEFKAIDSENNIVKYLINKNIIQNGKINQNSYQFAQLHPYMIESLRKVKSFQTGEKQFKEVLEAVAFNSFAGIAIKGVTEIIDNSSNSVSRLKIIQDRLYDALKKP